VRPGRPVDGVLEDARDRVVVLGGHKQQGVGGADPPLELHDRGGRVLFFVLVEGGNADPLNLNRRIGMSAYHLTAGQRLTIAFATLEEIAYANAIKCVQVIRHVRDLESALADAGITERTHPKITNRVCALHRMLRDDAVASDTRNVIHDVDIAESIHDRRNWAEGSQGARCENLF
jgi:hypothetical protein